MVSGQIKGAGLSFTFDTETHALIAAVDPDPQAAPIDEPWLRVKLAELGHGALRYLADAGTTLLAQYNAGLPVAGLCIAEAVDATLLINISPDKLQACLDIAPAEGGKRIIKSEVLEALTQLGVSEGIAHDAIDQAIAAGEAVAVVVARGRAAMPGRDGRLQCLLAEARNRAPRVLESGQTDFRDLGEILVVHPGDPMMLRHPPTQGVPGVNVHGTAIPTSAGKPVVYAKGLSGVAFAADNPEMLVAAISGQPVQVKGGMIVEPVYTVASVDIATGNVVFDGSVKVVGNVGPGMTISATGDIEIGGVAEPCKLEAEGSIAVRNGALGNLSRKDAGEYFVRCGGSFTAGYAQQLKVEAGDSIFIDDMVMQCDFSAGNHIRVGNVKRGHIIGGRMLAGLSITGKVLGSPNRIVTRFEIGVDPELHKRMRELSRMHDGKEAQLLEVTKLITFGEQNPGRIPTDTLARARNTAANLSADLEALSDEATAIEHQVELAQNSRVVAEQAMHEGVTVQLGNRCYRVVGEHGGCAIAPGEDGLELFSLSEINLND